MFHAIQICVSLSVAAVLIGFGLVAWCRERQVIPGRRLLHVFRHLPWYAKIVLIILIAQCIVHGSTKTNQTSGTENGMTNAPLFGLLFVRSSADIPQPPVSDEDIERGFQLVSVSTNNDICYVMPEDAEYVGKWHLRGAYDDVAWIDFDDWRFPLGSNSLNQLWAFTWGRIRPEIRDTVHEIAAVGTPMSAVPSTSRLWMSETIEGSRLITWESFVVGRLPISQSITNASMINAQVELYSNGDFVTRSNNVESTYRHIDPNDWDGDGWQNDDDDDPIRKAEPFSEFCQSLPYGANENAYCWVDIVTPYHSHVEFVGDGYSDLEDPVLISSAGVTNRIQLLIGKTYAVSSDQPITVTDMSSSDIEITGNGTCALSIVYPIAFSACDGNGGSFTMFTSPSGLTGAYEWTSYCCPITGLGNQFWYAHNWCCLCDGCQARGGFRYEGYSLPCDGGWCCCPCYYDPDYYYYETQVDDGPYAASASVSFSEPAVIFEDAYTNRPDEVVSRRSTTTILTCTAHGGSEGTVATFWLSNGSKIVRTSGGDLPLTQFVPPGQKLEFEVEYEGCQPSRSANDIVAYASVSGSSQESSSKLTSVRLELCAVDEAYANPSVNRHLFGVNEWVNVGYAPLVAISSLRILSETDDLIGANNETFFCPWTGGVYTVQVIYNNVEYLTSIAVIEPQVVCRDAYIVDIGQFGQAGLLDMRLALYVEPTYVSFKNLYMEEVIDNVPGQNSGYFSSGSVIKTGALSHTYAAGAGRWHFVKSDTSWIADRAARETPYPQPWSSGWKEWRIPVGWGDYFGNLKGQITPDPTTQRFEIDSNGTAIIQKYNHSIIRSTDNQVWLDGVLQN